ncbi:MAG: tetratricopeptide repeat protein [Cyanobacteria bacterium J06634_6]
MQSIAGSVGSIGNNISFNQISPTGKDSHKISLSPTNVPGGGSQTFVGRAETLQQLHRKLSKDDSVAITAIQGMGGIGKTELARQYAKQYAASYPGGRCWLQVRELDVASQIVAFARVYLRIEPPDELALLEQVVYCWNHWPGSERVLVVYDDVTKSEQVAAVLPPGSGRFAVLMTTRRQHLAVPVEPFEIEVLNEAAALELLRQIVGVARTETQLETAKAICEWVGYLPLGLELLGQYLRQKPEVTYQTLQRRLELQRTAARALQKAHPGMTGSLGVIEAFELSQQTLPKEAQDVACWLSLFALAPIPWELAESRIEEIEKKAFEDGRDTLISRSLLQRLNLTSYQLHPLVREYFLTKLAQREDSDAMRRTYCQIMVALAQQMPSSPTRKLLLRLTPVMPHIAEVATSWQDWLSDKDDELAWPFVAMARFYEGQGAYTQAEPWYVSCLQATQNRLGEEHPAVAASLNNLATLYKRQGRYEEAEPLYAQSLKLRCKLLGEKHPAVATSLNNLATLYENQGRYEEAEPLYVQSLELSRELLGEEHPTVATSLNNLAALYLRQARYEEAEPLYVRSLELGRKLLGKEHPTVATSLNNLAALYEIQGRYKEAEPLYLQSLELRHRLLGEEHPDVATSLNNLAHIYKSQGRYKEAEPLFLESLKFNRQSLGEEHPDVATSLNNLAALYENQSRYEEAETLYMKSLAMRQKLLGERHLAVATSLDNLAGLYSNQGRYEEADSLYMQAIAVLRSHDKITPKPV